MADGIEKSVKGLITLGIGVFMLVLFLNLTYQEYATTTRTINTNYPDLISSTTSTASAINQNALLSGVTGNTLTFTCTGSCGWLNGNNTVITIAGWAINPSGASNTVYANTVSQQTEAFTITNSLAGQQLSAITGNFFTVNSVTATLTNAELNAAFPSVTFSVTQTNNAVAHNSAPATYTTNTITGQTVYALSQQGVTINFSTYGAGVTNAYGSNLTLAITALVLIAIVVAILYGVRDTGLVGGFVG